MLKKIVFAMVVCTCVSVAFGAAVKIRVFLPMGGENQDADGMAVLNYVANQNKTIVQLILSDFNGDPKLNGLYFLRLSADDGSDDVDMGMFLVGSQGNGNFHGEVSGDHSGSSVTVWAEPGACGKILVATGSQ